REPWNLARAKVSTVTAQVVVVGMGYPSAAHREQVQIADQLQQVGLRIDQRGLVALLEQMPGLALTAMYTACVLATEPLHEAPHRHVGDLNNQADRIGVPTVGVHARPTAGEHGREQAL